MQKKWFWLLLLLILSIYSINLGVSSFSYLNLLKGNTKDMFIVQISRLPRLMSIIISGAGLAISGIIMQTITRNKFVAPSTAGTMEWCRLGIVIILAMFPSATSVQKMLIAFGFSFFGTMLFVQLINRLKFKDKIIVPLIGIMFGSVVGSITNFIAYQLDIIQNVSAWMQGNFSLIIKGRYELLYIGIFLLIIAYIYADHFTIAGIGESFSKNLGVDSKKITMIGLTIIALITSTIIATVGTIPFIGLIVPNIVSLYRGDNLKKSLLETALIGSCFVLACDILGRSLIFPYEISISVIISIVGSIIFLTMIFRKKLS